jgi:hypothetical protein
VRSRNFASGRSTAEIQIPASSGAGTARRADAWTSIGEYGAIDAAMEQVTSDHFEGWEAVRQFVQGNVCYCPSPWQAEATEEADDSPLHGNCDQAPA